MRKTKTHNLYEKSFTQRHVSNVLIRMQFSINTFAAAVEQASFGPWREWKRLTILFGVQLYDKLNKGGRPVFHSSDQRLNEYYFLLWNSAPPIPFIFTWLFRLFFPFIIHFFFYFSPYFFIMERYLSNLFLLLFLLLLVFLPLRNV